VTDHAEHPPRPNDPQKLDYGPVRPTIVRSEGTTKSEQYLSKLCDRSFLNLWSYPNLFKSDGKELCDLLVVCGDHIIVFSDKTIAWPSVDYEQLAWKRWCKRAIMKSVDQIRGAERWISKFPDRIFLDQKCTQRLPLLLPPIERRKVHGIVVALGAGEACKKYFGEGIGSLMITPSVQGDAHWKDEIVAPFVVGDIDPSGAFIHVLDDATLDIVMQELDTITDLTAYLSKKENLIRSKKLLTATGEEELVAYYMTHMNLQGEHDFTKPDGTSLDQNDHISFSSGFYENLLRNPQYLAKKSADRDSYVWDRLIEAFTDHMLAGTTIVHSDNVKSISDMEQGVRHMALVPRYIRSIWGERLLDALHQGKTTDRFTRAFLPGPTERNRDTGFFFMTLAVPNLELADGYNQYRKTRRNMLEVYALAFLRKFPNLKQIVGIATEPPSGASKLGSSEDMIIARPPEWTSELLDTLEERKKIYGIAQEGNYKEYEIQRDEFPKVVRKPSGSNSSSLNRQQRRAAVSKARRRK
jgi:hypothetical protein